MAQDSPVTLREGRFRFDANEKLLSPKQFPEWYKQPRLHA